MQSKIDPIHSNVVHVEPNRDRMLRARIARLPSPVETVRELSQRLFQSKLKQYFERADDALFDLADKASSNEEQNIFFDSMREVRVRRHSIESHFSADIDRAFASLIEATAESDHGGADVYDALKADALSLVHDDDLEALVAVDSSVAKANTEFGEAIQYISLRLDSLMPVKVYQKNNPVGADVVCAAFMGEVKKLDISIKAKLVLFRLFDKIVVSSLGDIYRQVNDSLIGDNVMPSLPSNRARRTSNRSSDRHQRAAMSGASLNGYGDTIEAAQDGVLNAELTADMVNALTHLFGEQVVDRANVQVSPEQLAANQFVKILNAAQRMPAQGDTIQTGEDIRSLVSTLRAPDTEEQLGGIEDQVMNLVNMLFDFILDDRNLSKTMKALLSRMQIPVIKVALADKTFFTKRGHVARKLLNEMSTAAMGWQGDGLSSEALEKDPLYTKMDGIVRTLLNGFDTDVNIFSELLVDFTAFLEKERKRVAVMERRTIDAEGGKAKAEIARSIVALEIEVRTLEYTLPEAVHNLVHTAWSNVLFVNALKYGYESTEWEDMLATLDELILSVQIPKTPEQRQRLIKLVPSLLKKLRSGLDTISYNPFDMSTLFKQLEEVHLACIRGKPAVESEKPAQTESEAAKPAGQAEGKSSNGLTPLEEAKRQLAQKKAAYDPTSQVATDVPMHSDNEPPEKQATGASDTSNEKPAEASVDLAPDDPDAVYVEKVKTFSRGGWFDMSLSDGVMTRCRLAAYIQPTGKYIFVNRNGMKVAEKSQQDLADLLKQELLRPLDDSMLFDRALETVVSGLRKQRPVT